MAEQTPIYCDGACYTAADLRQINTALVCGEGVSTVSQGDLAVTAAGGSMNINIAAGHAFIQGDTAGEGMYLVVNDATVSRTLTNGGVQDRIDLVVATVEDCVFTVDVITGVEAVEPVAPAVPANSIALGSVYVAAGVTVVSDADITDLRADYVTCGTGGTPELVVYAANGVFDKSTFAASGFRVRVVGGGGAGGGAVATGGGESSMGSGGGGGGYAESIIAYTDMPAGSLTVTVGSGGAAVSGAAGNAGGLSSFAGLVEASGGAGGGSSSASATEAALTAALGGSGTDGQVLNSGEPGMSGIRFAATAAVGGSGGGTPLGSGGQTRGGSTAGAAGYVYGGGGGGAVNSASVGAKAGGGGAGGVVLVEVIP